MKTGNPAVKLTYDDFVQFPDDGKRHELIDGVHYVTPSPNMDHQQVLGMLHGLIWTHLQMQPVGKVFLSPFDVVLSMFDVVEPEIELSREAGDVLTTPLLQRLSLPLARVFKD